MRDVDNSDKFSRGIFFPWILAFILSNWINVENGGQNPASRWASLRSMTTDHTFAIDRYKGWSDDWSQTNDGHIYSNKAPGPMLLGAPLFWVLDKGWDLEKGDRGPTYMTRMILCFVLQVIPFAFLVFLFARFFSFSQSPPPRYLGGVLFGILALFWGNTSAQFMNLFFGHSFATMWILGAALSLWRKRYRLLGLCLGFSLLSEYASLVVCLTFAFILMIYYLQEIKAWSLGLVIGGIVPGLLWIWYHTFCFGSPFLTAAHFENPLFEKMYLSAGKESWLGLFTIPDMSILGKLLFGSERGILFTQPWILLLMIMALGLLLPVVRKVFFHQVTAVMRMWTLIALIPLVILLVMNSSFTGWHSGASPGPRYICIVFPLWAILATLWYPEIRSAWRKLLWALLFIALIFRSQVIATTVLAPLENLWVWQWEKMLAHGSATPWIRMGAFWLLLAVATYKSCESPLMSTTIRGFLSNQGE